MKKLAAPLRQHQPQHEIQRTVVSVQAPSSSNNDMLVVAIVVQQIIRELSEADRKSQNNGH
jgi:hypothetical protein